MSGQTIALSLFLFLVAFGVVIVLGSFIFIKRSIARRKSRIGRIVYTPVGNGAPKVCEIKSLLLSYSFGRS